jgi:hypothetical protein
VKHGDVVAEEPGGPGAGVGDQRLLVGQLQLEVIAQERRESTLDVLRLVTRADEPEEPVG